MASSESLREQVAQAIRDTCRLRFDGKLASTELDDGAMADAAIRVVLAAVAEQVKAVPYWQPGTCGQQVETYRSGVLAAVARLGDGNAVPE